MIELLRKLLPYALVLFFLYKANKKSLYLLGIPFLMFMSQSIFFENAKPFQKPGSLYIHLNLLWLILLWLISKLLYSLPKNPIYKKGFNTIDLCVICLILISTAGLISNYITYYPKTLELLDIYFLEISLYFGYFIIKDWFSDNNWEEIWNFLFSLIVINSIAAVLYILHQGLHLNIYLSDEFVTESVGNQEITRSFWFMPQFLPLSIIFLLTFRKNKFILSSLLIGINLLAIVITYTVSSIIIAITLIVLFYILKSIKKRSAGFALRNLALYTVAGIAGIILMSKLMPANTKYLLSRITDLSESSYTQKDPNTLEIRFANNEALFSKIDDYKKILGLGPISINQVPYTRDILIVTSDMAWAGVVLRWGYVGLLLFIIIYLFSLFQTYKIFQNKEGIQSDFGLALFLYLISQILEGFVSWTFLSGHGLATGLWYFSLISLLMKGTSKIPDNNAPEYSISEG